MGGCWLWDVEKGQFQSHLVYSGIQHPHILQKEGPHSALQGRDKPGQCVAKVDGQVQIWLHSPALLRPNREANQSLHLKHLAQA